MHKSCPPRYRRGSMHLTHCLICAQVAAMAEEARRLDGTLVPSQSTRYEAGNTIAYDKEGVRSTQILGGTIMTRRRDSRSTWCP